MNVADSRPAEPTAPIPPAPAGEAADVSAYDYDLPPELIAQEPLPDRDAARLMVVDRAGQVVRHAHVRDLPQWLEPGDLVVFNNTRVSPARLIGRRVKTGGAWEGLFLHAEPDGAWRILARTRGKIALGETIELVSPDEAETLILTLVGRSAEDGGWLARPAGDLPWTEHLDRVGHVPLPPYIRRGRMREDDRARYQTVFAARPGAVAAPTAGLHFTERLLTDLRTRGIETAETTLHVGIGTFRPIAVDRLADHRMHAEWGELTAPVAERIAAARARGGRVVAIGTTVVRVLESAAAASGDGPLVPWQGWTELFIRPPYRFQAVDALFTNFHFPRSTLLVLVRTFGGDELLRTAYSTAVAERYRFFSYGDAMLIR